MRDDVPADQTETVDVDDTKPSHTNSIEKLQLQNKLLKKQCDDLRSDLRLEVAAYDVRKVEIENMLELEMKKMKEEKNACDERINAVLKEKKSLEETMIQSRSSFQKEIESQKNVTSQIKHELDSKIQMLTEENQALELKYDECLSDLQNNIKLEIEKHKIHKQEMQKLKDDTKKQLDEVISKSNEDVRILQDQYQVLKDQYNILTEEKNELKAAIYDLQKTYDEEKEKNNIFKLNSNKTVDDLKDQIAVYLKQTEELNERLRKESSEHEKKLNKMKGNHDKQKSKLSKTIDELKGTLSNKDKAYEEELDMLKAGYNEEIKNYLTEIDNLKIQMENNSAAQDKEKIELKNEHESKVKDLTNQIDELNSKIKNNASSHKKQLNNLNVNHEENVAVLRKDHNEYVEKLLDEITTLKTNIENDAVANDEYYNKMKTKLEQEIIDLVASHRKEFSDMKTNYEEKMINLTTSHDKEYSKMKSSLKEHAECQAAQRKTIDELKCSLEQKTIALQKMEKEKLEINNMNKSSTLSKKEILLEDKVKELQAAIKAKDSAYEEEKAEMLLTHKKKANISLSEVELARKEVDACKEQLNIYMQRLHLCGAFTVVCVAIILMNLIF